MSAATEQNNGDVAVEKVAAAADVVDAAAVKEDLKSAKPAAEGKSAAKGADNGTNDGSGDDYDFDHIGSNSPVYLPEQISPSKGTKRPAEAKTVDTKKAKKDKAEAEDDEDVDDEEEILEEITEGSEVESDEYDIPYDEDIECEDDDDENDDGSASDDEA